MPTIYTGYRNYTRFYLSWDVAQQDIANNRSLISWTAGIQGQPGINPFWGTNAIRINSVYIDGQGSLASGTWSNITLVNGQTVPLRSGSIWVGHNSDGTKSFGASISGWLYANGDLGASGYWSINTIPRNSQVTTNKDQYVLGEPITIYTNRKSSSFTHQITLRKDNSGGETLKVFNNVADSVTWTPTPDEIESMQNMIPSSNNFTLWIYQHNWQVGQGSEAYRTLQLTNANPIFTDFTYQDSNAAVVAITGDDQVLVKGESILQTRITPANKMQAVKGASPSRYAVVFDGTTDEKPYQASTDVISSFDNVSTIGQRTIVATAFDTRNNNTSVAKQVTVYDYGQPTIESSLKRENNFGTDTTLHLEGRWSPLSINGSAKNSILSGTLEYRYKEDGGSFGSWKNRPFTTTNDTWAIGSDVVISLDNTKKYVFEFRISDRFRTTYGTASVDVGKPIMFTGEFDGSPAIGIGKMPDQAGLDVSGPVYSDGNKVPFGGWDQIAKFRGIVNTTTNTLTFAPYKYIRVVVRSQQTDFSTTQHFIRLKFGGGGSSYTRNAFRLTNPAGIAYAVNTADSAGMIAAVSRSSGHMSYFETEMFVTGTFSGDLATYDIVTQDADWLMSKGNYFFYAGTAQMSPLTFVASAGTYSAEITVYGHN